jgi:hypothetical protein
VSQAIRSNSIRMATALDLDLAPGLPGMNKNNGLRQCTRGVTPSPLSHHSSMADLFMTFTIERSLLGVLATFLALT